MNEKMLVSLVIPVFNEAESIGPFIKEVGRVFSQHGQIDLEFVFVNDGSTDETLPVLLAAQKNDLRVRIVELSRNFGKEAALSAGLEHSTGQVVVPIDVDLQDPPEIIINMIEKWNDGYEVVLAKRTSRVSDTIGKRYSAKLFYRAHNWISPLSLPEDVGDFRLMDRVVVEAIKNLPEGCRFMKGIFAWVGFRTTWVEYTRVPRIAGKTKFDGWGLWNFALEGITSFTTIPLRIWTYIGFSVSFLAFAYAVFIVANVLVNGIAVPGYASVVVVVSFLGGLQLLGIGVVGEYLGRTYIESKRRPIYVVRRIYDGKGDS